MENLVKLLIKKLFHQTYLKIFYKNILSGNIKDNEAEDYRGINDIRYISDISQKIIRYISEDIRGYISEDIRGINDIEKKKIKKR